MNSIAVSNNPMKLRVLDAFAGAGGFSLGFHLAGSQVIGAIEQDAWAAETFAFNHKGCPVLVGNIENFTDNDLKAAFGSFAPNVIVGGPPCQGFSVCRKKTAGDPTDPRNSLFEEFIRLGRLFSPDFMVMENVPNLTAAKTKERRLVIDIIVGELEELGYSVKYDILQAVDFGVPQIRKRLFVIASKTSIANPFPDPTHGVLNPQGDFFSSYADITPTLWDAISDLPRLEAGEGEEQMTYTEAPKNAYQAELRRGCGVLYNHVAMKHSRRMVQRFAAMKWGESVSDVPDELKPFGRNSNGVVSGRAYDQNNRRMHPDRQCHTIPASFYANFVHPYSDRNFTAREGARIQSFPDWYVFKGKPTVVSHKLLAREGRFDEKYLCQYNQIGNAVPPLLAKAIAENIKRQFEDIRSVCSWRQPDAERESHIEVSG